MAAYFTTPNSPAVVTLVAATAAKVPASAQVGRVLLKLFNDDPNNPIFYGGSGVTALTGIPIAPGDQSDWIPCSGDIWCISTLGTTVRALEGA